MSGTPGGPSLHERIERAWPALAPQEQRAAAFLRARPDESALYNSSELARLTGVSKATVSRMFRRLGFADSAEARDVLRARRGSGVPVAVGGDEPAAQLARDVENLRRLHEGLDRAALAEAAEALAAARRVLVIGFRSGFPVAMQLRQALAQTRSAVVLLPEHGQTIGEEVPGLTAEDVVVLVALRRRPAGFGRLAALLAASPARVVLIGEPGAPGGGDWRFTVPIETASAFDSYAAAASLVSLLADRVLRALGGPGEARVAAVAAAYHELGELDPL